MAATLEWLQKWQEAANHLHMVTTLLISCRNIASGRGYVVLNQVTITCARHGLDVGPLFGISQDFLFHKPAAEWVVVPSSLYTFLHAVAWTLAEEYLDFLSTLYGIIDFLYMIINKDNKYNNCCYRHHSCYNECRTHVRTLVYTVSIF